MKSAVFLMSFAFATAAFAQNLPELKVGKAFPIIEMPRSDSGKIETIRDHLGEKLMVHLFAGW